jgi:hypothetical protein
MTIRKIKCRALCPWSKTASSFMDEWQKLCNKMTGHSGMHKSVNGAVWSEDTFSEPPGIVWSVGYKTEKRLDLSSDSSKEDK